MTDYLTNTIKILSLDANVSGLENVKLFVSEIWRLNIFLPENIIPYELSEFLDNLNNEIIKGSSIDDQCINTGEQLLLKHYLAPLELPNEKIQELLEIAGIYFNTRIIEIFEKAIKFKYFPINENTVWWKAAYINIIKFLRLYGFQDTYYLHKTILADIKITTSNISKFRENIAEKNEELKVIFNPEVFEGINDLTSNKAIKILFRDTNKLPRRNLLDLILDVYDCFPNMEIDTSVFIQKILWKMFSSISSFLYYHRINSLFLNYEKEIEKVEEFKEMNPYTLCPQILEITIEGKSIDQDGLETIQERVTYIMKNTGVVDSSRFNHDRVCLFGRFAGDIFSNDIFIDPTHRGISRNHFIIISGKDGYYISDISQAGSLCRKLRRVLGC